MVISSALATSPPSPLVSTTAEYGSGRGVLAAAAMGRVARGTLPAGLARGSPGAFPGLLQTRAQVFEASGISQVLMEEWHWGHFPADRMPVYYVKNKLEFLIYTAPEVLSTLAALQHRTSHLPVLSSLTRSYSISILSTHSH